jgi:hypothetical protein
MMREVDQATLRVVEVPAVDDDSVADADRDARPYRNIVDDEHRLTVWTSHDEPLMLKSSVRIRESAEGYRRQGEPAIGSAITECP